jgi:hypothetical protein
MFEALFKMPSGTVNVRLQSAIGEEPVVPQIKGNGSADFKVWIRGQYGMFGHLMNPDRMCINDLRYVVLSNPGLAAMVNNIETEHPAELPDGSVR